MLFVGIALWLAAADDVPDDVKYMTETKAREIVKEKLPESCNELDSRLGIIRGTSVFQLGKIDRLIPIALLNENGDVTVADAIPGSHITSPINLLNVTKDLNEFCDEKEQDLKGLMEDIKKKKGTVVDFQLIDDMASDPGHPWIHSATYNKTASQRKLSAVKTVLKSWTDAISGQLREALKEYIPPYNVSAEEMHGPNVTAATRAGVAWIQTYSQCTRIVLVAAQLLKKFSAKRLAQGLRITDAPLAVPINVRDYLNLMELATAKASRRMQRMIKQVANEATEEISAKAGHPEINHGKVTSFIESESSAVANAFGDVDKALKDLRTVVLREHDALKAGFLPKASSMLLAYSDVATAFNNANNITRAALKLPPIYLSYKLNRADVLNAILHGHMAELFYGKKLGPGQTLADWPGIKSSFDTNGTAHFESTAKGAPDSYRKLRHDYEARTPGYAAYDMNETNAALRGKLDVAINSDGSLAEPDPTTLSLMQTSGNYSAPASP